MADDNGCPECGEDVYEVVEDVSPQVMLVRCRVCEHLYERMKWTPHGEESMIDDW